MRVRVGFLVNHAAGQSKKSWKKHTLMITDKKEINKHGIRCKEK